jgi:hypothetical protein
MEIADLVLSASTTEELQALTAFQKALEPYFETPDALRTVLSKIQAGGIGMSTETLARNFASVAELEASVPDSLSVVVE